ncbi:hypothetical protein SPURM210S_00032 [Streptomyces purpurascens]
MQTYARVSARRLRELVERIGGADDHFLVVQRIPDRPNVFIQVAHDPGGPYAFQHRTGSVPHMWVTEVSDPGPVAEVMTRWARQEDGWDAGVAWQREEFGVPGRSPLSPPTWRHGPRGTSAKCSGTATWASTHWSARR